MKHASFAVFIFAACLLAAYLSFEIYQSFTLRSRIFQAHAEVTFGPADADLKVAEFFSYDCVPCQSIYPVLIEAVKRDGRVLYIPRPVYSGEPESVHAAVLSYAAAKQGKFMAMHETLIGNFRVLNEEMLDEIGVQHKIDLEKLGTDLEDPSVAAQVEHNQDLYDRLGVQTKPVFLIGKDMLYVPPGDAQLRVEDILALFEQARAKQ